MLENFKLSFDPGRMTVAIESPGKIGLLALYRKIRAWEASEDGIVFDEIVTSIGSVSLPGGDQTALVVMFINGWRLESKVEVAIVGGLVAGRDVDGKSIHPVVEDSQNRIHLQSKDKDFIPTEVQIQHADSEASSVGLDWQIDPIGKRLFRKSSASTSSNSVFGLYWFLKGEWIGSGLMNYEFPLQGDNRPPVPGVDRRWDLKDGWEIDPIDQEFLSGGPLVHRDKVIIPSLSEDNRQSSALDIEITERRNTTTIGIMTALPEEYAAVLAQLDDRLDCEGIHGQVYVLGTIPAKNGGIHRVVLTMTNMGNNMAASKATELLCNFPSVTEILMVGIAGAVPNPNKVKEHVRLGDIVVSGAHGVVQYDHIKDYGELKEPRHLPRPPSSRFLQIVRLIEAEVLTGASPWQEHIDRCTHLKDTARPHPKTDQLAKTCNLDEFITHPHDPSRVEQSDPRLFVGTIGAANILLKDPKLRDQIRNKYGVKAVEMESSGIADSTLEFGARYFVVRGTCDYCDVNKKDEWHGYAAVLASAFMVTLLNRTPALTPNPFF